MFFEKDELNWFRVQFLVWLDVVMGGCVVEEIIFGKENIIMGM